MFMLMGWGFPDLAAGATRLRPAGTQGVLFLETVVHRFLTCVGFWGPMMQLFQALLVLRYFE